VSKRIVIEISTKSDIKAVNETSKSVDNLGKKAKSTTSSINKMDNSVESFVKKSLGKAKREIIGFAAGFVAVSTAVDTVRSSINKLDSITSLEGRLRLATDTTAEFVKTQKDLLDISNDARIKLEGSIDLYTRLKRSTEDLNKTNLEVLSVTDAINKSTVVSGSSAIESEAALKQLGQGLAAGVLRGEEFNSVMEQTPRLARAIADGVNVGTGKLREMAMEGKLTAEVVFNAILSQKDILEEEFRQMPKTIEQSFNILSNSNTVFLKELDEKYNITKSITNKIDGISFALARNNEEIIDVIDNVVTFGQATVATYASLKIYNGVVATTTLMHNGLTTALVLATAKQRLLNIAVKANPYIAVATGIYGLIEAYRLWNKEQEKSLTLEDRLKDTLDTREKRLLEADKNRLESSKRAKQRLENILNESAETLDPKIVTTYANGIYGLNKEIEKLENSIWSREISQDIKELNNENPAKEVVDVISAVESGVETSVGVVKDALVEIGNYREAWLIEEAEIRNELVGLEDSMVEKIVSKRRKLYDKNIVGLDYTTWDDLGAENEIEGYETTAGEITESQLETAIHSMDEFEEKFYKMQEDLRNNLDSLEINNPFDFDFNTDGFEKYNKVLNTTISTFKTLSKNTEKFNKYKSKYDKLQTHSAEDKLKLQKMETENLEAQYGAYANLAGGMASAFEQGSAGAIAFTTIQSALGIASSWTAIAEAWALGFPQNIPAVAMVTSAVMPIISQLGGSGSSGGGAVSSPFSLSEMAGAKITELEDGVIVDELKQQTSLLDAIEKNGSSQKLNVELAAAEFEQSKNEWVQEVFDSSRMGYVYAAFGEDSEDWKNIQNYYSSKDMVNPFEMSGDQIRIRSEYFRENVNDLIKVVADMSEMSANDGWSYTGPFGQKLAEELGWGKEAHQAFIAQVKSNFSEIQGYLNDWAISVVDSTSELKNASEDMREMYDSVTGTSYFADIKLSQAFSDFDSLLQGGESYADYLVRTINNIESSTKFIYQLSGVLDENGKELTNYELLLSKNGDLIEEQMAKVADFGNEVGVTFDKGIEEALNYIDSIELVADAMVTSRENKKSFIDSFKTEEQQLKTMANNLGISVATTVEELFEQFDTLSRDRLTNEESEYLNAVKSHFESATSSINNSTDELNEYLTEVTSNINSMQASLSSLSGVIDKLSGATLGSEYTLNQFYKNMDKTLELFQAKDTGLKDVLNKTIGYADALLDSSNFSSAQEMEIAQLTALNQFEMLEDSMLSEIDILKQIEENTRFTVESLSVQSSDSKIALPDRYYSDAGIINSNSKNEEALLSAYEAVYKFTPDIKSSGFKYWMDELSNNKNITLDNIDVALATATDSSGVIKALDYLSNTKQDGSRDIIDRLLQENEINENTANKLLNAYEIVPFAHGGIVTKPTLGLIGEAGYPEIKTNNGVVPLKNPNDPLNSDAIIKELRDIKKENKELNTKISKLYSIIDDINERGVIDYELKYGGNNN